MDDYVTLENSFVGVIKSNGVKYKLYLECDGCSTLFGVVRYILPDSDASGKDVQRGYFFNSIDDTPLTLSNYQELLGRDSYKMNFADLENSNFVSNGKSVDLVQEENFVENPFHIVKTFDIEGMKIGYIMYNGFDGDFENELNQAFLDIQSSGATELILDLRYNGGGYGYVAADMATAITGQFNGEILSYDQYNGLIQAYYEENYPEYIIDRFSDKFQFEDMLIPNLNLSKLHVITTNSSASASELLISALSAYIDVATIGTKTFGKYTGSVTLYDSDNLRKDGDNFNTNHTYAMQPIILQYTNKNGETVQGGLAPTVEKIEYLSEFGPLGDPSEPLLAEALAYITGSGQSAKSAKNLKQFKSIVNKLDFDHKENGVLIKKELPKGIFSKNKRKQNFF